ncbi:hypothetical protein RB595_001494 [Gaeumannomyces hyphopodioides]
MPEEPEEKPYKPIIGLDVGAHISTIQPPPPIHPKPPRRVPLPKPGRRNVLITSALLYANDVPHLGNIVSSVLSADVFARYNRACGVTTLFVGGTDEHGTTTQVKAAGRDCSPQELGDRYHRVHADIYDWFGIEFDVFGRTTNGKHAAMAQDAFAKLARHGLVEVRAAPQLYCEAHRGAVSDRLLEGTCRRCGAAGARGDRCVGGCGRRQMLDGGGGGWWLERPRCGLDGAALAARESTHAFLRLDALLPEVQAALAGVQAGAVGRAAAAAWMGEEGGLAACCITRDMAWGTPVPRVDGFDMDDGGGGKVMWSWFDACVGHASMTAAATDAWERWWRSAGGVNDVRLYQFMGEDQARLHSVLLPAAQLGTRDGWTMPHHLSVTGRLTCQGGGGGRFSTSRGVGVFADAAVATGVDADVWRWCLLWHRAEDGADVEFCWDSLVEAANTLAACLGRAVLRVLDCVNHACFGGVVPDWRCPGGKGPPPEFWLGVFNSLLAQYRAYMDSVRLRDAMEVALRMADQLDVLLLEADAALHGDGANVTEDTTEDDFAADVGLAFNAAHLVASAVSPFVPAAARAICDMLAADPTPHLPAEFWIPSVLGEHAHEVGRPRELFGPIHPAKAGEWRRQFGGGTEEEGVEGKEEEEDGPVV